MSDKLLDMVRDNKRLLFILFSATRFAMHRIMVKFDKNLTLYGFCGTVNRKLLDQSVGIGEYYEKKNNFKSKSNYQRSNN